MPEDREDEQPKIEVALFRELEEAKEALLEAVGALNEARDSPSALEPARAACLAAYQRYHVALERFRYLGPGPEKDEPLRARNKITVPY